MPETPKSLTCADLDSAWTESDWEAALTVLTELEGAKVQCGVEALASKRYAVHINYGAELEAGNERNAAIAQFRAALALNGQRHEALRALARLDALPPPTVAPCSPQPLEPYDAVKGKPFAQVRTAQIVVGTEPYDVRGLNYYPRDAPWQGFIQSSDLLEVERELDLVAARGFNTLRIFLWYDALFQCEPERAEPIASSFQKLDAFFRLAHERDLRLIVTLNDLPDFYFRPIYTDWARYDAQTQFIVRRYRDEPTILAWDVRNEADIDYGVTGAGMPNSTRTDVIVWLAHVVSQVRANDENHLVTAGWLSQTVETEPFVDVLSFHHWSSEEGLADKIASLRKQSAKPILVQEMGVSSAGTDGAAEQAERLTEMVRAVESTDSTGWLIWTAFDFFALPDASASPEYRFGLWRNNLEPKPALDRLPLPTRDP